MAISAAKPLGSWVLIVLCAIPLPMLAEESAARPKPADALAAFESQTLRLPDGKRMNCHARAGNGPALVLVPGTWGDIHGFMPLIALLPKDIPIIVIELCWQGGHVPPTLDLSIEELADDVVWVLKALKVERFYVGGHSIGGMITVELAGRNVPGLMGAIPLEGWTHHTVVQTAFDDVVVGELTSSQKAQRQAYRTRGRGHLSDEQLKAIASIWRRWNGFECLMRSQVPILHIWGDRGKPRRNREALQIPNRPSIQIAWITGASHLLLVEAPEDVAELIGAFIQRNKDARRKGQSPIK
jgi:pimeloyl-ACP methyl ester carboxylesterase